MYFQKIARMISLVKRLWLPTAALFTSLLLLSRASAAASGFVVATFPTVTAATAYGAPPPAAPVTLPGAIASGSTVYLPFIARNYALARTPNDPGYGFQWGLPKVNAPQAWGFSTGAGVVIAIVDTGVDLNHPDLAGKIVGGYNFVANNSIPQDDNGHGTHVAGIAAAITNNGIGVAGLGWDALIMPVKVLDSTGSGSTLWVANGITWAVNHGAKIINLSLGDDQFSQTLQNATDYAFTNGVLVVAAAGNCGDSSYLANGCSTLSPPFYPAANANVLGVGATTQSDTRASFSSYGYWVDVTAPGYQIYSTLWNDTYGYESGTSMASPLVAGLASLVWAARPALSNSQVASIIMATAVDLGPAGRDDEYGYGRIDAAAAMASAITKAPALATANLAKPVSRTPSANAPIRSGVLLLRWKSGTRAADRQAVIAALGLRVVNEISGIGVQVVSVPPGRERALAAQLAADPSVEFAEPDYLVHAF